MRRLLVTFLLISTFLIAKATKVEEYDAKKAGKNYLELRLSSEGLKTEGKIKLVKKGLNNSYYLYSYDNSWILISGDNDIYPVLAYSLESGIDAEDIPAPMQSYMDARKSQCITTRNERLENKRNQKLWNQILKEEFKIKRNREVDPLIETKWNQDWPYNALCPEHDSGSGGHVYAGCVATAMAQVMNYYEYPQQGRHSNTYYWAYERSVDFSEAEYHWDSMTNTINQQSRHSIAKLLFHCGVAVNMDYGHTGSSSSIQLAEFALKYYFKYKSGSKFIERNDIEYDYEIWKNLIMEDLDKGHPVLYRGVNSGGMGHAFICDGYKDTTHFHFNWGWSGSGNGYFHLDGTQFNWYQAALFNIMPYWGEYCDEMVYNQESWSFGDGSGPNYYWNDSDCSWLIKPDSAENILISFEYFKTMPGDTLYLYDGESDTCSLIASFSQDQTPNDIFTPGNSVYLRFKTNSEEQDRGWKLNYETIKTGVDNINNKKFKIYPNPVNDYLFINNTGNSAYKINIYDSRGELVMEKSVSPSENKINLSDLTSGMYFVSINNGSLIENKKIIIK